MVTAGSPRLNRGLSLQMSIPGESHQHRMGLPEPLLVSFARATAILLARQKAIGPSEKCVVRFVPRTDANPNLEKPAVWQRSHLPFTFDNDTAIDL